MNRTTLQEVFLSLIHLTSNTACCALMSDLLWMKLLRCD